MPYNASGVGSTGELISHWTGVRLRIVGAGDLHMQLQSLDAASYFDMLDVELLETNNIEPFRGANFVEQRCCFKGSTTEKDDYFLINRIVIFGKPLWAEYPQVS